MKRILGFAAFAFVAATASAQVTHTIHGDPMYFGETVPPATFKWELGTAANQRVTGALITGIPGGAFSRMRQWGVRESTAAMFGVDWLAFQVAANDPAFTRSILTFGGVEKESPLVRSFTPANFRLDSIGVNIDGYVYPANVLGFTLLPFVNAGAAMAPNVPEPASWVLVALCFLVLPQKLRRLPS